MANIVTDADSVTHESCTGTDVDKTGTDEQYRGEMNRLTRMLVSRHESQEKRMLTAKTVWDSKKLEADVLAKSIDAQREKLIEHIHEIEAEKADINQEIEQVREMDLVAKKASLEAELKSLEDKLCHQHDDYDDACCIFRDTKIDYMICCHYLDLAEMLQGYEKCSAEFTQTTPCKMWNDIKKGRGDFHDEYSEHPFSESDETIALEYFEEYLDSLVNRCDFHDLVSGDHC